MQDYYWRIDLFKIGGCRAARHDDSPWSSLGYLDDIVSRGREKLNLLSQIQ
jgi:hypothetical protein